MKKVLFLALLAVVVFAMPSFASVQNIKVSGDVDTTLLIRNKFDLGLMDQSKQFRQNLLFTQTKLRVDADLTDNVGTTLALINERVWGQDQEESVSGDENGDNDIDINLAYVTMREMLYSPLTVIVGRQSFAYGNSFIIDSAGVNNTVSSGGLKGVAEDLSKRRAMDAVRMVFDYNPLTIDLVAAKVDSNNQTGVNPHDDDVDLFGTNANWALGDENGTELETYFWAKIDQSVKTFIGGPGAPGAGPKADTVYVPGLRAETNILDGLNLSGEMAWQFGNKYVSGVTSGHDNQQRRAMGAQVIANYKIPLEQTKAYSPMLTTAYTFISGDNNPAAGKNGGKDYYQAWDPMFENQSTGKIYNTLFDLSNAHIGTVRGAFSPMEDLTAAAEWNGLWLHKRLADDNDDGLTTATIRQPDGTAITAGTNTNTKIGDDLALELKYDYTEDVQLGASYSWFFPGNVFRSDNDSIASQVLLNANVIF